MPRTKYNNKIKKKINEKEEILAERLREYDAIADQQVSAINARFDRASEDFSSEFKMLNSRFQKKILQMTLNEIFTISSNKLTKPLSTKLYKPNKLITPLIFQSKKRSKDDEGYLTEDSCYKNSIKHLPNKPIFCSAKVPTGCRRRSRSASSYLKDIKKDITYSKALSVSCLPKTSDNNNSSPAIYRWPKPGEPIISLSGSPIVSSMTPVLVANVNIPIRNGMFSLRPKRIDKYNQNNDILENIEPETLQQIKQLHSNLSYIMSFAKNSEKN